MTFKTGITIKLTCGKCYEELKYELSDCDPNMLEFAIQPCKECQALIEKKNAKLDKGADELRELVGRMNQIINLMEGGD
jgi:hypothetical protein